MQGQRLDWIAGHSVREESVLGIRLARHLAYKAFILESAWSELASAEKEPIVADLHAEGFPGGNRHRASILVVDDDPRITTLLMAALSKDGYAVTVVNESRKVVSMDLSSVDLILCDVMMPHMDGFALLTSIRERVSCPIIFLTAKTDEDSAVLAYGLGADDYIRKPFGIAELRAKVRVRLSQGSRRGRPFLHFGPLDMDLQARQLKVDGRNANLTDAEYRICALLAEHPGRAYAPMRIWEACLAAEDNPAADDKDSDATAAARVHLSNARRKLKALGVDPIRTIWSVGYQWVA